MLVTVKEVPIPEWTNSAGRCVITNFNKQEEKLKLDMYKESITTLEELEAELQDGMYDFVYPDCLEAEELKVLIESAADYPRYIVFSVEDLNVSQGACVLTRISMDKVRNMCVSHEYYTQGTSEQYDTMLATVNDIHVVSGKFIYSIAQDIKAHSDTMDTTVEIADTLLTECCYNYLSTYIL